MLNGYNGHLIDVYIHSIPLKCRSAHRVLHISPTP